MRILVFNLLALAGAVLAVLPLLVASGPAGRRIRLLPPRVARIIPLGQRRHASPRA